MSFEALFTPRGVVVAGSVAPGKLGYNLVNSLVSGGCQNVYAINPKAQGLGNVPGYASAQEIGKPLDLVVVASPAPTVKGVLEDCGKAGIKAAIIISSGFSEAGHPELEEEVKEDVTAVEGVVKPEVTAEAAAEGEEGKAEKPAAKAEKPEKIEKKE